MLRSSGLRCDKAAWQKREAYIVVNDLIRLVTLTGGGHIAELRFADSSGLPTLSPLWVPPWKTIEPYRYKRALYPQYGPASDAKLLSGIVGHNLCLDYFGVPSDEEAAQGLSFHGEAPNLRWRRAGLRIGANEVALTLAVNLPVAGLEFTREIRLRRDEQVVYFKETVTNLRKADHFFHWTQHCTLGPPFLSHNESQFAISATKGKTDPHGYDEGKALLAPGREFRWPLAPALGGGVVDLTRPFPRPGLGLVVALLLDPRREVEFLAAVNTRHRLMIGYCFRRRDFPWMAVWDENRAIAAPPWNSGTQARGLEFGATPFAALRRESFALGPMFGTPTLAHIPARGRKTVRYVAFLTTTPRDFKVRNIRLAHNEIMVQGMDSRQLVRVAASEHASLGLS